jgi:MFS family permease
MPGVFDGFWIVLGLIVARGLLDAASMPIRQAYLNGLIPSEQRASILSFDSLVGSSGGVVVQPVLGRAADVSSYGTSYAIGAGISALALPFILWSRRQGRPADTAVSLAEEPEAAEPAPAQAVP